MAIQLLWWYFKISGYTIMGVMCLQFANRVNSNLAALFGCYCVLHAVTVVIISHREGDQLKLMFHINAVEDCHSLKMCGCYHDYHR